MSKRGLYAPLYLKFSLPIFLVVVLAAVAITWLIVSREAQRLRYSLEDKGRTLAQYVSFNSEFGVLTNNQEALQGLVATVLKFENVVFAEIRDAEGKQLALKEAREEPAESEILTISVPVFSEKTVRRKEEIGLFTEGGEAAPPGPAEGTVGEESFLETEAPEAGAEETGRERIGSVTIGLSMREMNTLLGKARATSIAITCAGVLLLSVVMAVLVRFVTGPLKALVAATRKISEGDLTGTMPTRSRDEIGELTDSFNRMVANLKQSMDELHQTSDFSQAMIPPKDLDGLLEVILNRFLSVGKVERAWIFLANDRTGAFALRKMSAEAANPPELPEDDVLREFLLGTPGVRALEPGPAWAGRALAGGVTALTPLKSKEALVGCVALGGSPGRRFSDEETDLLNTFASIAAMAIENLRLVEIRADNELLKMELRFAHEVQMRLLPQNLPDIQGFRIHPLCIPAREIGGDYYDFIYLDGGAKLGISIADVAGKGVPAALYMASSRSLLKAEAAKHEHPGGVLSSINSLLYEDMKDRTFVSMFYGVIDTVSRKLEFANAGHLSPILIRQGGKGQTYLKSPGLPLGITSGVRYADTTIDLRPDDVIIFYTDGLIEAMNADKELFGFERLESAVRGLGTHKPQAVVERIMSEVNLFVGGEFFSDDLTLIALEVCR